MENDELLPEIDVEFLQGKGFDYELVPFAAGFYLIIKQYEFPNAYLPRNADMLIILPMGYPNAPVDMFFTIPDVKLTDGTFPLNSNQHPNHDGKKWQQWSRHIVWRIGIDNLRTYFSAIKKELIKGI